MAGTDRENNTDSVNRNTESFNRLNGAINGLGSILGNVIQGAPQRLAPLIDTKVIPGLEHLSKMMAFAEGYVGVWQDLTRGGIHFNNQLDEMIIQVGKTNLTMEQFTRIIGDNQREIAGMGGTAQRGVNAFIQAQQAFMQETADGFNPARVELERLGFNAETLGETFASFDALATIQGIRGRMDANQRNQAAANYAKTLDELARLTGKQVDALAEEQAEISRQGNVFAFGQTLQDHVRDELDNGLLALSQVSPTVRDFAIDVLTRGFPNMNDPEMRALNAAAPGLRDALMEARQAFLAGDEGRAKILMDNALAQSTQLRNNQFLINQAMLGSATDISNGAMNIMTELGSGMALSGDAIAAEAERVARLNGDVYTGSADQIRAGINSLVQTERENQTSGTGSQVILDQYLEGLRKVQSAAMNAQEAVVRGIFVQVTAAAAEFISYINGQGNLVQTLLENIEGPIGDFARAWNETSSQTSALLSAATSLENRSTLVEARLADQPSDVVDPNDIATLADARQKLAELMTEVSRNPGNADLQNELSMLMNNINTALVASGVNPQATGTQPPLTPDQAAAFARAMDAMPTFSLGTMGTAGRLFENFGRESLAALHGLEAVTTPEQMAAIVQQSALGGMRAQAEALLSSGFTNNTSQLDGMLNTVRKIPSEISQTVANNNEGEDINALINTAMSNMRENFETAMTNTLVPKLEELVAVNTQSNNYSEKIRRGIGNLSGDMLRST